MNIFVLDKDPWTAARLLCDQHVVKMTLETTQILCTVARKHIPSGDKLGLYKATHTKHPCTLWADNPTNYHWLLHYLYALLTEYALRYDKQHNSSLVADKLAKLFYQRDLWSDPSWSEQPTSFVLAMPDEYKSDNPVESYKNYYEYKSRTFVRPMTWTGRPRPSWLSGNRKTGPSLTMMVEIG